MVGTKSILVSSIFKRTNERTNECPSVWPATPRTHSPASQPAGKRLLLLSSNDGHARFSLRTARYGRRDSDDLHHSLPMTNRPTAVPYGIVHFELNEWGGMGTQNERRGVAWRCGSGKELLRNSGNSPHCVRPFVCPGGGRRPAFGCTTNQPTYLCMLLSVSAPLGLYFHSFKTHCKGTMAPLPGNYLDDTVQYPL